MILPEKLNRAVVAEPHHMQVFTLPPIAVKIKKRTEDDMSFVRMVYCEKIVCSGMDAGNGFRMRKKICTSEARHPPANASRQPFF